VLKVSTSRTLSIRPPSERCSRSKTVTWCRAKTESVVCSAAIVRVQGEGFGAMPAPKLSAVSRSVRAPKVKVPAAEMETYNARLERSTTLPKYEITIKPKQPRGR